MRYQSDFARALFGLALLSLSCAGMAHALLKELGTGLFVALGGLGCLWAFTWAVGWIVRGFMGIPRGLDQKPQG